MVKTNDAKLSLLFEIQAIFQHQITGIATPVDDVRWFQYHMSSMMEELGEVLKADKRWKTHRNTQHDQDNKIDEIADVFIVAINLALYSGIDGETMANTIADKIARNYVKAVNEGAIPCKKRSVFP